RAGGRPQRRPGEAMNSGGASTSVLVPGGAGGLGAAVDTSAAQEGWRPGGLGRRGPAAGARWAACDLADSAAAEAATWRRAGGLDAVVTAAAVDVPGRLAEVSREDWERVVTVDLLGTAAVVRAALPELIRARGAVVTVASTLGRRALSDATAYCAAKFGVVGFTRALAAELAGVVGVTLLLPGGMRTGFFDGRDPQYRPAPDAALNDPASVAAAVMFALGQPAGCAVRELVICPDREPSYP